MPSKQPNWDLLIVANGEDEAAHTWFPARARHVHEFTALEGLKPRNVYITSKAIEKGSWVLFQILYRAATMSGGGVFHTSDYQETE
jgi:hypothetical protein